MTREATNKLLEMVEEGLLDKDTVIMACVKYMSEDEVADMCHCNDFFYEEEEEEEETHESIFYFDFTGREVGAIGITYPCNMEIRAKTYEDAIKQLYVTHDHIRITHWTQWQYGQQVDGSAYKKE